MTRSLVEHYGSLTRAFRAITQDGAETRQMQCSKRQLYCKRFTAHSVTICCMWNHFCEYVWIVFIELGVHEFLWAAFTGPKQMPARDSFVAMYDRPYVNRPSGFSLSVDRWSCPSLLSLELELAIGLGMARSSICVSMGCTSRLGNMHEAMGQESSTSGAKGWFVAFWGQKDQTLSG